MLIPLTVTSTGNQIKIDVYQEFYGVAKEYLENYKEEYFGDEALKFLSERIIIDGYTRYDDILEYYHVMRADVRPCCDFDNVVDIENAEFQQDETDFEAEIIREECQPASLIVDNGRIAAISSSNYFIEEDEDEVELAVETLPEYRGRGYGKAVLSHMTGKVMDMGKIPTYRVSSFNRASVATAKSCNYNEIGKEYYIIYYKED